MSTPLRPLDAAPRRSTSLRHRPDDRPAAELGEPSGAPRRRSRSRPSRIDAPHPRAEGSQAAAQRVAPLERPRASLPSRPTPTAPRPISFSPAHPLPALWEESAWRWHEDPVHPASMHALQHTAHHPIELWYTPEDVPVYKNLVPLTLDPSSLKDEYCPFSLVPVQSLVQPVALRADFVWHVMEDSDLRQYWQLEAEKKEPRPLQNPINRQTVQRTSSVRRVVWYARARLPLTPPTSPDAVPPKRRRL